MENLETELCFPQLLNTSCRKAKHQTHSETMFAYFLLSSITLLTICLNLLVIISISHFKKLQTPTCLFLLSLAVADLCVGFLMFFQLMLIEGCWLSGDFVCALYQYLSLIITNVSTGTVMFISYDRYVAICQPLQYSSKLTPKRVQFYIYVYWIFSIICQSLKNMENLQNPGRHHACVGECVFSGDDISAIADLICTFLLPISVIVVLYMRVFVVVLSQAQAMHSHISITVKLQQSRVQTVRKSEMKAARALGGVVVVFLLCTIPGFCLLLSGKDNLFNASHSAVVVCLFYFNSCLNPLIYAFFYPWFRKSVKLIISLKILQPNSCDANIL
ncbi:trace amine-associated receptor 13c-like [Cheilinus undulatus]|uniref:trace amine-associated receptor 13c-like n=1 Tax=Cheilinus undulatus TaxID=241271 RepID=UPI001BD662BE|nr:trace amine-associated receptor 13c-like [Cheilinus undulatus]